MAFDFPDYGRSRACNELRKQGIFISAGGVRSVWLRHEVQVFDKQLKDLKEKMAQEGLILTVAQIIALERKKEKRESFGAIETEHPGYLGSQDTGKYKPITAVSLYQRKWRGGPMKIK